MLKVLREVEEKLPEMLTKEGVWNSVLVDYHKPFVKRLWVQYGDYRIYLHEISPCKKGDALLHTHPWPSAMKVLRGVYAMELLYENITRPVSISTLILPKGAEYEMVQPSAMHDVRPIGTLPTLSLMVTGKPYESNSSPKPTKVLSPLKAMEKKRLLSLFREMYPLA